MPSSGSISSPASGAIARAAVERVRRRRHVAEQRVQKAFDLGDQARLDRERPEPLDERCRLRERVVGDPRHRRVAAAPVHAQHERGAHLLGGRAEVEHLAAELDAVARALVDREVRADRIRVSVDEPLQAEAVTDLLVGCGDEDQVAVAAPALARERRQRDGARRDLALHVERAAAPDLAVDQLARRTARAATRARRRARRRCARAARATDRHRGPDAGDEVRALGHLRVQLALDARGLEVVAEQLRGRGLVPRRVRRVDPDQALQKIDDLGQRRRPLTSRYGRSCVYGARVAERVQPGLVHLLAAIAERLVQGLRRAVVLCEVLPVVLDRAVRDGVHLRLERQLECVAEERTHLGLVAPVERARRRRRGLERGP